MRWDISTTRDVASSPRPRQSHRNAHWAGKQPKRRRCAALVVSFGCEGTDTARLVEAITSTGKPVEVIGIRELGGASRSIAAGIDKTQKLSMAISGLQREEASINEVIMSIKYGASDATSGMASNCVIGYVADKVVDLGGTVIFGETTEFIGAEHILAQRGRTPEVGRRIHEIVDRMEKRAKSLGCDMRKGQPTPGNIAGGLSSIEEKSLGAIMKSGMKPIEGVYGDGHEPQRTVDQGHSRPEARNPHGDGLYGSSMHCCSLPEGEPLRDFPPCR